MTGGQNTGVDLIQTLWITVKAKKMLSPVSEKGKYDIRSMSLLEKRIITFFFFFGQMACGTLVPQPGIEPMPTAVEAGSLNH